MAGGVDPGGAGAVLHCPAFKGCSRCSFCFFRRKFRQKKGGVLVAFVGVWRGYLEEWSTFSCRGANIGPCRGPFCWVLESKGACRSLFFTNNTVFGGHAGVSGCHKKGGRSSLQTKSHVGGSLSGFQGEEVARCPLSRPCRRRF